jgi:DNA-binding GntR family transcriptional regulator
MARTASHKGPIARDDVAPLRYSDIAYEELRERILDLRLSPGMVVNEQSLADSIRMGRMPVREALARLATDQLIVVLPRRGAVVALLDLQTVVHIFDAREAVECGIAHVVARRVTADDLDALRVLVDRVREREDEGDAEQFLRDDQEVHSFLVSLMGNPLVQDAAERLLMHNIRFWRMFFATRPDAPVAMISYQPLLDALEARDGDRAANAMREHLSIARRTLQSAL